MPEALDPDNPSSISFATLEQWKQEGAVDVLEYADEIEKLIDLSTMVVLPSYREGTPRILLEAAAMGKALVATDVPGCREVVEHGKNGLLVPAKNSLALADAMETLLKNPTLCQQMGMAGRDKVVREFDVREVVQKTAQVYERMGILSPRPGLAVQY